MLNYSYNLVYDAQSLKLRLWAFLIKIVAGNYVSIIKSKDMEDGYAGLKKEDLSKSLILVIDFEVPEDFEALDENYINSVSDKRIYEGKEAINKCLMLNPLYREFFEIQS